MKDLLAWCVSSFHTGMQEWRTHIRHGTKYNELSVWRCLSIPRVILTVFDPLWYYDSSETSDDYEPDDPKWSLTRQTRQHTSLVTKDPLEAKDSRILVEILGVENIAYQRPLFYVC